MVRNQWLCVCFCEDLGAAYGTAKSGVGVSSVGVMRPDLIMRSILPVIMAGILGIYGLIISIVITSVSEYCFLIDRSRNLWCKMLRGVGTDHLCLFGFSGSSGYLLSLRR